jgi:hypothetical protein
MAIFCCTIDETGIDKNDLALLSPEVINVVQSLMNYLKLYLFNVTGHYTQIHENNLRYYIYLSLFSSG